MNFKDIIKKGVAVHCNTEDKANDFLRKCKKMGFTWDFYKISIATNFWEKYRSETCYGVDKRCKPKRVWHNNINWLKENGFVVVEFDDVVFEDISARDFKVGDTAYLMNFHGITQHNESNTTIDEVKIVYVGNKYVKVQYPYGGDSIPFYRMEDNDSPCLFLVEKKDRGENNYLFKTQQYIKEFQERK